MIKTLFNRPGTYTTAKEAYENHYHYIPKFNTTFIFYRNLLENHLELLYGIGINFSCLSINKANSYLYKVFIEGYELFVICTLAINGLIIAESQFVVNGSPSVPVVIRLFVKHIKV